MASCPRSPPLAHPNQTSTTQTQRFSRGEGCVRRARAHIMRRMSHVTRRTQPTLHVTRHTSHVTRHTSHVTRHTSHITHHTSHVTRHTSHASHLTRPQVRQHEQRLHRPMDLPSHVIHPQRVRWPRWTCGAVQKRRQLHRHVATQLLHHCEYGG